MTTLTRETMKLGGHYNWKSQPDRLIYLGRNWSGNGYWHQFKKIGDSRDVWCEVTDSDLHRLEETLVNSHYPPPKLTPQRIVEIMRDGNNCNYNDEAEHIQFAKAIEEEVSRLWLKPLCGLGRGCEKGCVLKD